MEIAYAEHFTNGTTGLDEYARVIPNCSLKSDDFSGLQGIADVNVFPVDGKEFAVDADISHMKVHGEFRHVFAADDSDQFPCGVFDFRVLNE